MGTGCTSEYKEAHRYQMPSQAPHTVAPTASTQKQTVTTTHPTSQTMNPVSQYVPAMYPSINQHYSGVVQAPKMSTLPPIVGSYPNPVVVQPRVVQNQVEQVDLVKARLKSTRDRVNNLIARQEADLAAVDRELMQEKANGLRNKPKVKYLLKQRKDYLVGLDDLRTRQQVVMKTVSDLERQHLDKSIVEVLEQSNQYMQQVQEELQRKNWREVLLESKNRQDVFQSLGMQEDPEVDRMFAELEKQVQVEQAQRNAPQRMGAPVQQAPQQFQQGQQNPNQYVQQQMPPQQVYYNQPPQFQQQRPPMVPGVPFAESMPITDSMNQFELNPSLSGRPRMSNIPPQLSQMNQQMYLQQTNPNFPTHYNPQPTFSEPIPVPGFQQQQGPPVTVVVPPLLQAPKGLQRSQPQLN